MFSMVGGEIQLLLTPLPLLVFYLVSVWTEILWAYSYIHMWVGCLRGKDEEGLEEWIMRKEGK